MALLRSHPLIEMYMHQGVVERWTNLYTNNKNSEFLFSFFFSLSRNKALSGWFNFTSTATSVINLFAICRKNCYLGIIKIIELKKVFKPSSGSFDYVSFSVTMHHGHVFISIDIFLSVNRHLNTNKWFALQTTVQEILYYSEEKNNS